jgi:hypothetical protein
MALETPPEEWLRALPTGSVGAEIGVWKGDFTKLVYQVVQPRQLHLVDPWLFQPDFPGRMFGGAVAGSQTDMNRIFHRVKQRFAEQRPIYHRKFSSDALQDFEDESLDWVYIDGNHHYRFVKADLEGYWHKLVPGGLLTGDDMLWGAQWDFPVQRAVSELLRTGTVEFVSMEKSRFILRKSSQKSGEIG